MIGFATMFGAEQVDGPAKKERRKLGWVGGFPGCGKLQTAIAVLSLTTLLLFLLLMYVISAEETTHLRRTFIRGDLWRPDRALPGAAARESSHAEPSAEGDGRRRRAVLEPEVQRLVDALAASARVANAGEDPPEWTEADSREWRARNPCRSREEMQPLYARRNHAAHVEENAQWSAVVREYAKLHRTCIRNVGDLGAAFALRNSTTGCKFLIADVMQGTGLGNKVLVVASNVLYAILTQRVVLVPLPTLLPLIMCEPLEGSTWAVDNATLPFPPLSHRKQWQFPEYFYRDFDTRRRTAPAHASAVTFVSKKVKDQWHPRPRFYCSSEQARYRDVPWLYVTGCLYTLPNLFAVGAFRPALEALFPDRMALTHLLRALMLPGDEIWGRATRIHDAYMARADKRVGVQVRYKDGQPHYEKMNDAFNARITKCAIENGILPNVSLSSGGEDSRVGAAGEGEGKVVVVFIACLYTGLHDHLTRLFLRNPAETGESVALVQVTHEDAQEFGVEVDRQALAEVLALSFSDHLFVTPISTYGSLAQAYGALVPWFIEIRNDAKQSCTRGRTVDICYQGGARTYECPHDPDVSGKAIAEVVPYLVPCLYEDYPKGGVQLITDN